jgi:hypothetical protein
VYTGARGLGMEAWFEGLRKGHAFVTTGPLVELTVNGRIPGEEVSVRGVASVDVEARVRSITPLRTVAVVFNGTVLEEFSLDGDRTRFDLSKSYPVRESGWFHLRAEGSPDERYPLDASYAQAFTNPVWVEVDGKPVRSRAASEYSIQWIDKLRAMAEAWPGWRSEKEKEHVFAQFDEAKRLYQGFLAQAPSAPTQGPASRR